MANNPLFSLLTALSLATYPFAALDNPIGDFFKVTGVTAAIAGLIEEELNKQKKATDKENSDIEKQIESAVYMVSARHQNELDTKNREIAKALEAIASLNDQIQELQTAKDACVNGRHEEIERLNGLLLAQTNSFGELQKQLEATHKKREDEIRNEVQSKLKEIADSKHDWDLWKHSDLRNHEAAKAKDTQHFLANLETQKQNMIAAANQQAQDKIKVIVANCRKTCELYEQAIAEKSRQFEGLQEQASNHIVSLEGQINALQEQLHQAQRIRYFTGKFGSVGLLGNKMINRLAAFKIYTDADHCETWTLKPGETYLEWWINLREDQKEMLSVAQIMGKKEDLKLALGFPEADYNKFDLKMEIDEGVIHITALTKADVSNVMSLYAKDATEAQLVAAAPYMVKKALLGLHFGLFGQTGAGKSKLAGNIINFLRYYYKVVDGKDLRYQLFDLKFPSTDWELDGQRITPDWKDIAEYREGLLRMQALLENRIREWADAEAKGLPKPKFDPYVFIIDESEEAYARLRDIFSKPVGYILRIGRALNVSVMIVGQSPNCSAYGFLKSQMFNMTRFWLGAMTLFAFKELGLPQEYAKPMRQQIMIRQNKAIQELSEGIDPPPSQFYAIAAPPALMPFVFDLPEPDAYNVFTNEDVKALPSDACGVQDVLREMVEEQARLKASENGKTLQVNPNPINRDEMPLAAVHNQLETNPNLTTLELMMIAEEEEKNLKSDFSSLPLTNSNAPLPESYQFVYDRLRADDYKGWVELRNTKRIREMGQQSLELILSELVSRKLVERSTSKAFRVKKIA